MAASQAIETYGIEIDKTAPSGEFYWDLRSPPESSQGPQSKFDLLLWLGQLPDTNVLSNSLIKMVGQHVFDMLYGKATYKSIYSFLQSRREKADQIFEPIELESLWHCWRLIAKLRALQEIDYLYNHNNLSVEEIDRRIDQAKSGLKALYPDPPFEPESREANELASILGSLDQLAMSLRISQTMMDRNAALQNWQQSEFRRLIATFQQNQGEISAEQHDVLPRENWANTQVTREAEKILQDWEFGEVSAIRDTMLFRDEKADVFYSGNYQEIDKRSLLFAAMLGENQGPGLGLDVNDLSSFQCLNQKNAEDKFQLYAIRDAYENMCDEVRDQTIALKEAAEQDPNPRQVPQLESASCLTSEWWDLWSTTTQHRQALELALAELKTIRAEPKVEENTEPPEGQSHEQREEGSPLVVTTPLAYGVSKGKLSLTRPADFNYVFSQGDVLTSALRFLTDFSGYFDQMMDKHPFIATAFFSVPYLQFGGIGLSMSGNDGLLAVANFFSTLEAQLAGGKISAAQINHIIRVVDEGVLWFTSAESSLQVLITCGFTISKVSYTLVDALVNELFNKIDETTLTELARKLDPTGSLEGTTTRESMHNTMSHIIHGLILLTVAGGIGVAADLCESAVLEFFAHVPVTLITNPSIQTLGALKTSGLLIGKLAGINNYISKEQLIGVNGIRLSRDSAEFKLLIFFAKLSSGYEKLAEEQYQSSAYQTALKQFEKLINLNPPLVEVYGIKPLKELGVRRRASSWYQRLPMACFKTVFFALLFAPAILAHIYYGLRGKPIPPMWKLGLTIPLNWVVLTGKIFWTSGKAVVHGFVQVAARIPEVAAQLCFVALRLSAWALGYAAIAIGQGLKALGSLLRYKMCQDPSNTPVAQFFNVSLLTLLRKAQIAIVSWLRINFRYPLEQLLGAILKFCRDILVRIPEQALQQAFISSDDKETSAPAEEEQLSVSAEIHKVLSEYQITEPAKEGASSLESPPQENQTEKTSFFSSLFKRKNKEAAPAVQLAPTSQTANSAAEKQEAIKNKAA